MNNNRSNGTSSLNQGNTNSLQINEIIPIKEKTNGKNYLISQIYNTALQDYTYTSPCIIQELGVSFFKNKEFSLPDTSYVVEIAFKNARKKFYRNDNKLALMVSELVIVGVEAGIDIGTVCSIGNIAHEKYNLQFNNEIPDFTVVRHANEEDIKKFKQNNEDEFLIIEKSKELIKTYKLDMKISDSEWQFDRQRLTIYFTAPQRIDFRDLVKELARSFKTRIELRQISTREEAKRIGGIGCCGLKLCCTNLLCDFNHVTLDHARTQQLSNNIAKLSGYCGRLKCCLLFEYDSYTDAFKKYPHLESIIEMPEGKAKIQKVDIFKDLTYLYFPDSNTYKTIEFPVLDKLMQDGKVIPPLKDDKALVDAKMMDMFEDVIIDDEDYII